MIHIIVANSTEEFVALQSTAAVLPIVVYNPDNGVYIQSIGIMINKINKIAGEDIAGIQTSRTDTDNQLDEILGETL